MKKYGKMIGVDVHPRTFRHSFAIHLVRNGMGLQRLGKFAMKYKVIDVLARMECDSYNASIVPQLFHQVDFNGFWPPGALYHVAIFDCHNSSGSIFSCTNASLMLFS